MTPDPTPTQGIDVEKLIYEALSAPGIESSTRRPTERGYRVKRVGGPHTRVDDRPRLVVDAYGATETDAEKLAQIASDTILELPTRRMAGVLVYSAEITGPANDTDPIGDRPRYSLQVGLHLRGYRR